MGPIGTVFNCVYGVCAASVLRNLALEGNVEVFYHLDDIPALDRDAAVTFGVFDGVHIGHQAVIKTLLERAKQDNLISILVGFYPHPLGFLAPERCPPILMPLSKRIEILEQLGIDKTVILRFDGQIASMSPSTFVERVLLEKCFARQIVVGYACQFGKGREGNAAFLQAFSENRPFEVSVVPPTQINGSPVHSTRIRDSIARGDLGWSAQLLGRTYSIVGDVVPGDGRGKHLGFPTANIETDNQVCPPNGVYAIRARLMPACEGALTLAGVLNIGTRPTFAGATFQIEAHFFDFDETIYGSSVEIFFVDKIRSERKFPGPDALVQQIQRDIAAASEILAEAESRLSP